ncbi:MAG: AraC family transcriptional regulator [Myxococcota bacterium]
MTCVGDEPQILASVPGLLIGFCESLGMDADALAALAGLDDPQVRDDPDALIDYEGFVRLWGEAVAQAGDRALGLEYARYLRSRRQTALRSLGIVGYAVSHCRDVRQAIELGLRYHRIIDPLHSIRLETTGDQIRVMVDHEPRIVALVEPMEYFVASMVSTMPVAEHNTPRPTEVCFRHARRHPLAAYTELVGGPVRFEASWYGVSFDAAILDLPLMGADPQLGHYLRHAADALVTQATPAATTLDARVRHAIDEGLATGTVDQASVARRLGMSSRTLQRGLSAQQTSFGALLDEVRRRRALELIAQPELSAAEIAFALGYGDPRTFYRSFRRWTGQNPTAYRRLNPAPRRRV